ncbi:SAC3/GANP/Nin1/mts3/eIF-3 p25 family-domain-containing protein [Dissophora ornata]|nr:SAC3/GANP/Nin1/mts3/eIF-3 p25 family-domain-containing protein [Dissophora ornata]
MLETSLQENGSTPGTNGNMSTTKLEKPAYLSVKSKKVKPLTTNVLESKDAQPSPVASTEWPPSLKAYVQRVFEALAEEDHKPAQEELKELVAKYHAQGKLWEVDWDNKDIPSKYRRKKSRRLSPSPELETLGAEERARREKRMRRFEDDVPDRPSMKKPNRVDYTPPVYNSDVIDWDEYTIVGTSTKLEKNYLRLTSAPDPSTVRPVHVLKKTLELLKDKWRQDQNYAYICNQFKSVRQDLTVQRIKNDFTVTVYEIHARIALEKGDLGEYNQCQTQLKQLYEYNLKGHVMEFTAYRILYLLHTRNPSDIIAMLASLTPAQKEDPAVKHALQVRTALASSNYYTLFKLYLTAPNMGGYLMDQFVERERVQALKTICKAYRPNIEVTFLVSTLGFADIVECLEFLKSIGVVRFLNEAADATGKTKEQYLDTKMALPFVMEAGKKYQMIDIKGQI